MAGATTSTLSGFITFRREPGTRRSGDAARGSGRDKRTARWNPLNHPCGRSSTGRSSTVERAGRLCAGNWRAVGGCSAEVRAAFMDGSRAAVRHAVRRRGGGRLGRRLRAGDPRGAPGIRGVRLPVHRTSLQFPLRRSGQSGRPASISLDLCSHHCVRRGGPARAEQRASEQRELLRITLQQHRRCRHHDRRRRAGHLHECRRRVADRLGEARGRRPAARRGLPHRQRRDAARRSRTRRAKALREGAVVGLANHTC